MTCVSEDAFRSQRFDPAQLPPSTHLPIWSRADDTGGVKWHRDLKPRNVVGRRRAAKKNQKQKAVDLPASSSSGNTNVMDEDDGEDEMIGAPCPQIDGYVIASRKRCCEDAHPQLIGKKG